MNSPFCASKLVSSKFYPIDCTVIFLAKLHERPWMSCLSCKYSGSPRLGERRIILGVKWEPLNQNTKIADADLEHLKIELKVYKTGKWT